MEFGVMVWGRSTEYFLLPSSYMDDIGKKHKEYLSCIEGKDKKRAYEISEEIYKICKKVGKKVDHRELMRYRILLTFYLKPEDTPLGQ